MEELGLETTIGRQSESQCENCLNSVDCKCVECQKVAGNSDEVNISTSEVEHVNSNEVFKFSNAPTLEDIRMVQQKFADDRHWNQYHKPRNLLLAMVGEVGELSEIFQWKGEVETGLPGWSGKEKEHLGQELSDVLLYLIRLAEKCHIDLPQEVLKKIELNKLKYPAQKVKGSSKKYDEYTKYKLN